MDSDQLVDRIYLRADGAWVGMSGQYYLGAFPTKQACIAAMNAFIAKRTRIVDAALAAVDQVINKEIEKEI